MQKRPRAASGACFQNIQPSKLIKHAKRGEERRGRNKLILSRDRTPYPDIPPRFAMCPGPEGPDRPLSPPGRKERVGTRSLLEVPGSLCNHLGGRGRPLDCPRNVWPSFSSWARVSLYLATARAPGPPCLCPPSLATHAPDALLASDCAPPSHVHPFVKTESRSVSVPVRLYGEAVARLTLPSVEGS